MSDVNNAPAPAAPAAPAEPSPSEVLAFDPFGPATNPEGGSATPGQSGEPGTPAEGEGGGQPGAQPQVPGSSTAPAAAPTPGQQPPVPATPQAQPSPQPTMQELVSAIRQAAQPQQTPAGQQPAPEAPRYNLQLPPQILTALRSEDPTEFATGMHSVVNGITNKVWTDVQQFLAESFMPQISQAIQANIERYQSQQQVAQQFYGKHAALAAANLRPLVQQAGLQVIQARNAAGKSLEWGDEVMDEIAEQVYKTVPQLRPAAAPPAPAAPKGGKQPFSTGQGTRPAEAGQKTAADELAEFVRG